MSILDQLITDRGTGDLREWQTLRGKGLAGMTEAEQARWLAGMRGSYTPSIDMNRVTAAMEYLAGLYRQRGYEVAYTPIEITHTDGTTDTTWRLDDVPTDAQLRQYLQNLLAFWPAVERAELTTVEVWENTGFGYVEPDTPVTVGDYARLTAAHGVASLTVTVTGQQLDAISAIGEGWTVTVGEEVITATYTAPLGRYEDLQEALDALVLLCRSDTAGDYADAAVTLRAGLRSGAVAELGTGTVHWSAVINWQAFEVYAYTWADVEAAGMTWEALERLPLPAGGDET